MTPEQALAEFGERPAAALNAAAATVAAEQARKKMQASAREAAAARHVANVAAGWPRSWSPAEVRCWMAAGGDLRSERRFAAAGWEPGDILELLDFPEVELDQVPPAGTAAEHRVCGVSLASLLLLNQQWPAYPTSTVLALERTLQSGRRQLWTICETGDRLRLRQLSRVKGVWRTVRDEDVGTDLVVAISATRALRAVRCGAINEYTLRRFPPARLLDLLQVSSAGGDEDGAGLPPHGRQRWSASDDRLSEIIDPALILNRWCTINDDRLVCVHVGKKAVPVLVDVAAGELVDPEIRDLLGQSLRRDTPSHPPTPSPRQTTGSTRSSCRVSASPTC